MPESPNAVAQIHARIVSLLETQTPALEAETRANHARTGVHRYGVSNAACRGILNTVSHQINALDHDGQQAILDRLAAGTSHEEKTMVGLLLKMRPKLRAGIAPAKLKAWIHHLDGWTQIDSLCQHVFTAEEMLTDWPNWSTVLQNLSQSGDERDQRAGLVLLVGPVRRTHDPRLVERAEISLRNALGYDVPLVQRAISWLLREMMHLYPGEVSRFLKLHESELPDSVVREVSECLEGRPA